MADILFMCSGCSTPLCVESDSSGQVIECPECKEKVLVPEAKCKYQCGKCHAELSAPADMAGSVVNCPDCNTEITVQAPPNQGPQLHQLKNGTESSAPYNSRNNAETGKRLNCPKCNFLMTITQSQFQNALKVYTPFVCPKCNEEIVIAGSPPSASQFTPQKPSRRSRLELLFFNCPHCGARAEGVIARAGETVRCRKCKGLVDVPTRYPLFRFIFIFFPALILTVVPFLIFFDNYSLMPSFTQEKVDVRSEAYETGYSEGVRNARIDWSDGSYDNMILGQLTRELVIISHGYRNGTSESGDFWEGYNAGYRATR